MSSFGDDVDDDFGDPMDGLDLRLLMTSAVTMFRSRALLDESCDWLRGQGYQVVVVDGRDWRREADLHAGIAAALHFPDYYGHNLDALNDCMRDVVARAYGWDPDAAGLVVVLDRYDAFARKNRRPAHAVLDIVAGSSRAAALLGRRLICLVQTDDPKLGFDPVGATPVMWNDAEWLDSNRRG